MPQPTKLIGAVERALDIMELFNEWTPELGMTEIAEATRLHKTTAAGLIHTLTAKGYLAQNPANRTYRLGPKVISRAKVVLSSMDLRQTAMPYLHPLRDCFNETVNLAIKAILTYLKPADLQAYMARYELPSVTAHTITNQEYLAATPGGRTGDLC